MRAIWRPFEQTNDDEVALCSVILFENGERSSVDVKVDWVVFICQLAKH